MPNDIQYIDTKKVDATNQITEYMNQNNNDTSIYLSSSELLLTTRKPYFYSILLNIEAQLEDPNNHVLLTSVDLRKMIQQYRDTLKELYIDGYKSYLKRKDIRILKLLQQIEQTLRVYNITDAHKLQTAAQAIHELRILVEAATPPENDTRFTGANPETIETIMTSLRKISHWIESHGNDSLDNNGSGMNNTPLHLSDMDIGRFLSFGKFVNELRKKLLIENSSTTAGLDPVIALLQLIYDQLYDRDIIQKNTREDLRYIAYQCRQVSDLIFELYNVGIIEDNAKVQRWIEFANDDLEKKLASSNVLNMTIRSFMNRFTLTWHNIALELSGIVPEGFQSPWKPLTDAIHKNQFEQWWLICLSVASNVINVFIRDERMLYTGVGIVIAAFLIFFLDVSK